MSKQQRHVGITAHDTRSHVVIPRICGRFNCCTAHDGTIRAIQTGWFGSSIIIIINIIAAVVIVIRTAITTSTCKNTILGGYRNYQYDDSRSLPPKPP
jgi:hypothetical protein